MTDVMDIYACQRKAQGEGVDNATFDLLCPAGIKKCKWLDAYFGFFRVEGIEGFISVDQIAEEMPQARCLNFQANGNHVCAIMDAVNATRESSHKEEA